MADIEYITSESLHRHKPKIENGHLVGCFACTFTPYMWSQSESEWDQWVNHLPRFAGQGPQVQLTADDREMLKKMRINGGTE